MTKYSKILAVFVLFASLAFMGFAAVNSVGGPNWRAQAEQETDYIFEYSGGDNPTWSVKPRRGAEPTNLKSSPVLAEVLIAARKHKIQQQRAELDRIAKQIPQAEARIKQARELIAIDLQAMARREAQLAAHVKRLNDEADRIGLEAVAKANEAQQVRQQAELRRADVFRLKEQLDQAQTDYFQVVEQRRQLEDLLIRTNGVLARLQRRKDQLLDSGATIKGKDSQPEYDPGKSTAG